MKVRDTELTLHLLHVAKSNPGRYEKIELSLGDLIDVLDTSLITEDGIGDKTELGDELL